MGGSSGSPSYSDIGFATVVDSAGNVYTGGYFFSDGYPVDFDPGPGVYNLAGSQYTTIFIMKQNAKGKLVWAKQIGSSGDETIYSMVLDKSGNLVISGVFDAQTDFDPGTGTQYLYSKGDFDVFIEKLDTAGNFIWAKSIGSTGKEGYNHLATDTSGNVYITGSFTGTADFDPGTGVYTLTPPYFTTITSDAYILKLNAAGDFEWAHSFGSYKDDDGTGITIDKNGEVYAAGFVWGNSQIDFDPGPGTYMAQASAGGTSFLVKLNSAGNFIWVKTFDSYNIIRGITTDQQGNIYSGGYFQYKTDFDPGLDSFMVAPVSVLRYDGFICKLDSAGNFVWVKTVSGKNDDFIWGLKTDTANNVYASGNFSDTADFDPGTGIYNIDAGIYSDLFVLKLDENGNFLWAENVGGVDNVNPRDLALDKYNNLVITGSFSNKIDFDPGVGTFYLKSVGIDDIFILKLNSQIITPVHLLTFTAQLKESNALLNWQVENELNFDRYQIERSRNGKDFTSIGTVKATNKKEYSYTDNVSRELAVLSNQNSQLPTHNSLYYRLKLIDRDGSFTYSPIRHDLS